jgi:hypothetical protein
MGDPYTNWFTDVDQLQDPTGLGPRNRLHVQAALRAVDEFRRRHEPGVFPNLERARIARGLQRRLSDGDSFNQGDTWLCGIATFVRVWAHDFPLQYAQLAIDLYEKGSGRLTDRRLGDRRITPSQALRESPPGRLGNGAEMDHADWIVLASIREAFNRVFNYTADEGVFRIKAWNFASDVESEFRAAGYQRIVNRAYGLRRQGYDNMMEASRLYEANWRVILLIDARLLSTNRDAVGGAALVHHSNHWVGLNQSIMVTQVRGQSQVRPFSVYSWDGLYTVPRWSQPLPLTTVIDSYFGFVAGHV